MDPKEYAEGCPGKLVPTSPEGVSAFVPDGLAPMIGFDGELMKAHGNLLYAIGQLEQCLPKSEFDPYLVCYPLMQREAFYSSRMEGTYTTPRALALFDESEGIGDEAGEMQTGEVFNYVRALEAGLRMVQVENLPICHRLIREVHKKLLTGVAGGGAHAGEYRKQQNYIGRKIDGLQGARFIPPGPAEMMRCMDQLERYMNEEIGPRGKLPLCVDVALIHYQFETIHPFEDGNGRIGRLLIPLLLIQQGVLREPVLHVSRVLEKRRDEYVDRMLRVSQRGDWRGWILFFLEALEQSAREATSIAGSLSGLRRTYLDRARRPRTSALIPRLIESLFKQPSTSFNRAARLLGVSHLQASKHVRRLEELGILEETTGGSRNLRFVANEILELVFEV